ncbi:MAG: alpha/beta fold hydrolase [Gemmatimonadota bacterium]
MLAMLNPATRQSFMWRWQRIPVIVVVAALGVALLVFLLQEHLIYFPRRYAPGVAGAPGHGLRPLRYTVDGNRGVAFWRAPRDGGRWWVVFSGNAALALEWDELLAGDAHDGFLLIDHPGYGATEGTPSPTTIDANADAAFAALAREAGVDAAALARSAGVLGHSLGAAIGLRFATRHEVDRVVLLSPFTTMHAMARRQMGWPLSELLTHRFDNEASLNTLAARLRRPVIIILHGDSDDLIPITMSRQLVKQHPWVALRELKGVGHDDIPGRVGDIRMAFGGS